MKTLSPSVAPAAAWRWPASPAVRAQRRPPPRAGPPAGLPPAPRPARERQIAPAASRPRAARPRPRAKGAPRPPARRSGAARATASTSTRSTSRSWCRRSPTPPARRSSSRRTCAGRSPSSARRTAGWRWTRDQFYAAFLAALDANGLSVYPHGQLPEDRRQALGEAEPHPDDRGPQRAVHHERADGDQALQDPVRGGGAAARRAAAAGVQGRRHHPLPAGHASS